MDPQALPELATEPPASPRRARAAAWHDVLSEWLAIAPIRVVNRAAAMPFQAQAIPGRACTSRRRSSRATPIWHASSRASMGA
jgi:hypothetical protein